jgi:hypothetical protein
MTAIDGNTLEGVSATTLWTLHNRGAEAKRSDGVIRDCAARFPGGRMMFDSIPRWFSKRTLTGVKLSDRYIAPAMPFGLTADEALALAGTIPGVRASCDVPWPPGRGWWRLAAWPALDRIGLHRRIRPSVTLLEFG